MTARRFASAAMWAALTVSFAFVTIPIVAILTANSPAALLDQLSDPAAVDALLLSLECSVIALVVVVGFGTPTAWLLATRRFRGRSIATTVIELPLVLPPAVAGLGLLAAFGPLGWLGGAEDAVGIRLVLETAGVVVALVFVSAPFHVRQAQAAFEAMSPGLRDAARTMGLNDAAVFLKVAVPTVAPALAAGATLAWARALGEFGATLMFAGSLRGVTQTAPLAIYEGFGSNLAGAQALAAVLVAASAALLVTTRMLTRRWETSGA
ncbi:MAG: molybdate ABC transporter permease subunit [Actinomycetes bacterium]